MSKSKKSGNPSGKTKRKLNDKVKIITLNYYRRNPDRILNEMLNIKLNKFESYIIKKLVQRSVRCGRRKNK